MTGLVNRDTHYGWIAIILHWMMAILMIGLIILGLYMTRLPISLEKLRLYGWHKEWGILVLGLVLLRWLWRASNTLPSFPGDLPYLQQLAARAMHLAFYGFMISMPLTGWMMSSAAGLQVSFFGWFLLPNLVAPNPGLEGILVTSHEYLGYALIAAIAAHTSAALWHHFIHKDDILRRMLP